MSQETQGWVDLVAIIAGAELSFMSPREDLLVQLLCLLQQGRLGE